MRLVAYYVPAGEAAPDAAELRAFLARQLPDPMVPTGWRSLPALPLTVNGKLDRAALPAPGPARGGSVPRLAPQTPVEHRLVALWAELLEIEPPGIEDDFFALGGYSLLGMRLLHRVYEAFGVEVPLPRLLAEPTVAGLARRLEDAAALAPPGPAPAPAGPATGGELLAGLAGMPQAEVDRMLAELLAERGQG